MFYLVVSLVLYLTLDPLLRLEDTLDRHVRVQTARALHLALIPLLSALTLLLHGLPLHPHGQAFLVPAVLTAVSLALVDDAGFFLATGIGQILTHGPLEESLASLAAERRASDNDKRKRGITRRYAAVFTRSSLFQYPIPEGHSFRLNVLHLGI